MERGESGPCQAKRRDGQPCGARAVRGERLCAGHLGLGLAADPRAASRRGAARSAEVRAERVEARKRGIKQVLAEAVEREYLDDIVNAYGRGLRDPDAAVAVRSAEALLSRVHGKPKETIEQISDPLEHDRLRYRAYLESLTKEQRTELWERIRDGGALPELEEPHDDSVARTS